MVSFDDDEFRNLHRMMHPSFTTDIEQIVIVKEKRGMYTPKQTNVRCESKTASRKSTTIYDLASDFCSR